MTVSACGGRSAGAVMTAAYVGLTIASMLPFPISSIAADLGANMLESGMPPNLVMARKILGYAALTSLVAVGAKLAYAGVKMAATYIAKHGIKKLLFELSGFGLAKRAWNLMRKAVKGRCGCFVAGTLVWTVSGLVPIEQIRPGDMVISWDEAAGELTVSEVEGTVQIEGAAVIDIEFMSDQGVPGHMSLTDEHPLLDGGGAWVRADQLRPGTALSPADEIAAVTRVEMRGDRVSVYNLRVQETETYLVGSNGATSHNCSWTSARKKIWQTVYGLPGPPRARVAVIKNGVKQELVASKELHHIQGRAIEDPHNTDTLMAVWPWEHAAIDISQKLRYEFIKIISFLPPC